MPGTRTEFWRSKFDGTVQRDERIRTQLLVDGWRVAVIWECAIRQRPADTLTELENWICSSSASLTID